MYEYWQEWLDLPAYWQILTSAGVVFFVMLFFVIIGSIVPDPYKATPEQERLFKALKNKLETISLHRLATKDGWLNVMSAGDPRREIFTINISSHSVGESFTTGSLQWLREDKLTRHQSKELAQIARRLWKQLQDKDKERENQLLGGLIDKLGEL